MNREFEKTFKELKSQRESLLSTLRKISPEAYSQSPLPGKWSISQILTHLLTSERVSLSYMKKKSLGVDKLKNAGLIEAIRLWVMIISQRIPIRYRAPKVLVQNTPEALPFDELIQQWDLVRDELASFLTSIEEKNVRKIIYKHPIAGRLDARQAMVFFKEHITHHTPQINRILNIPRK